MTAEQIEQKAQANQTLAKVETLLANEEFQWFAKTVIAPRRQKEAADALNIKKTPEERSNAAQRHDAIGEISDWLKKQKSELELRIKSLTPNA